MQVALTQLPDLGPTIKRLCRSHKFLCAIKVPVSGRVAVYAADTAAVDAVIAAKTDYPDADILGEYEFLSNDAIRALLATAQDPRARAMEHLGKVTHDQVHDLRKPLIL